MTISFDEMKGLVRPHPDMAAGFACLAYELRVCDVPTAVRFSTSWDRAASTIEAYAARHDLPPGVTAYVENFPVGPILVVAFSVSTLARIFPEDWGARRGDELTIWDGNHRLAALAIRRASGHADDRSIGVFVGS